MIFAALLQEIETKAIAYARRLSEQPATSVTSKTAIVGHPQSSGKVDVLGLRARRNATTYDFNLHINALRARNSFNTASKTKKHRHSLRKPVQGLS